MADIRKKAAALAFNPASDTAPRIVASGEQELAEAIVDLAKKHGVPVVEDAALAGFLLDLPPGIEIPENLYRAVSTVFAALIKLDGDLEQG